MRDLGNFTEEVVLPGVKRIVGEEVGSLREEMRAGFAEMRQGFTDVKGAIRELAGEVIELQERSEEHGKRISRLEHGVGIRPRE